MNVLLVFALVFGTVHLLAFVVTLRKLFSSPKGKALLVVLLDAALYLAAALAASFYIYWAYFPGGG